MTALERLKERIATLAQLRPSHKQLLEFYGAILKEQLKARQGIQPERLVSESPKETPPLLKASEMPIDLESARKLFRSLCRIAKKENQTLQEGVEKIQKAIRARRIDLNRLLSEMAQPDPPYAREVSSALGLSWDVLIFLGRATIQPSVEEAAALLGEGTDLKDWSEGICPVCGSLPLLSEIAGEEGRRMLICSFCGHRWQGVRTVCPFCNEDEREGHRYLFVEGDKGVRIDVCDKCKRYIKTIDTRETGQEIFPFLEHVGTLHLDILAQEKGYQKGLVPFLEIQ